MNIALRLVIVLGCTLLCIAGVIWRNLVASDQLNDSGRKGATTFEGEYRYAASTRQPEPSWKQIEELIRGDASAKVTRSRVEFSSLTMEGAVAAVQVVFIDADGNTRPCLYKLMPAGRSWRIASAQRLFPVPPSKFLRGLRV